MKQLRIIVFLFLGMCIGYFLACIIFGTSPNFDELIGRGIFAAMGVYVGWWRRGKE